MKMIEASMLIPMTILLTITLIVMSINIYTSLEKQVEYHKKETEKSYHMGLSRAIDVYDGYGNVIQ